MQDMRYAWRALLKSPVITAVAVLSLALGIGANTAIFSVINALLLRSLPVHDPEQLVSIYSISPEDTVSKNPLSLTMFDQLQKQQQVFSAMFAWTGGDLSNFEANGEKFPGALSVVSGDFYSAMGIRPLLGRLIQPADVALFSGTPAQVAVLDYRCWRQRYHSDPDVVGKRILLENRPLTIIGVTPASFSGLIIDGGEDVVVPMGSSRLRDRRLLAIGVYGRLRAGVSIEQGRAQVKSMWPTVQEASEPEGYTGARRARFYARKIDLESAARGKAFMRERLSKPLTVLMALVGIVLLIACVNLANLMLARAAGRQHELAVRAALGAGAWRLTRQLLTESMVLSGAGAVLGFFFTIWTSRLLVNMMWTGAVPLALDATPDLRVMAFAAAVALLTGLLFGMAPAWRVARIDAAGALRQNTRSVRGGGFFGRALVSGQVALSLVMLIAAALFVHSIQNLRSSDPGYQRRGVLMLHLFPQPGRQDFPNRSAYYRELVNKISGLPQVLAVSFSREGPLTRTEFKQPVAAGGSIGAPDQAIQETVGPGFFHMIGMRLLAGREFDWRDDERAPRVAVISESLAQRLYPGRDATGQKIILNPGVYQQEFLVAGVVNSASLWTAQSRNPAAIYLPLLQSGASSSQLDIRTAGDPAALAPAARRIVEGMGNEYPLQIQTIEERFKSMLVEERMVAWLSAFFGGLAMLLAAIGLYGLMSYAVTRRTAEIGIRMALGAERANVIGLVLREVVLLVGAGIVIGVPAALAASKYIAGMLFGLSPTDPATIAAATAVLFTVALFAGFIPARHASRIDPMIALRMD